MQPGNSPDNYRTSYGSDSAGRNMVTAPKPGGPILKLTEGGNLPKTPTFSGGIRDKVATTPADRGSNTNRVAGVIGKVGDYLGNVARSARDIPTAVGTVLDTPYLGQMSGGGERQRLKDGNPKPGDRTEAGSIPAVQKGLAPLTNYAKQVAQTFGAVAGGVKDNSRSEQYSGPTKGTYGTPPLKGPGRRGQASAPPKFAINEAAPRPKGPRPKAKSGGKENSQVK
jgi:hypothetical protein